MSKAIWLRLVLPLCVLSALLMLVHTYWDWNGVLLNAATEVLGIVITVAYVDWVIRRYEEARWTGTQGRIRVRKAAFCNYVISTMRRTFNIPFEALNQTEMWSGDIGRAQDEHLRFSEALLEPSVHDYIDALDKDGWARLARSLQSISLRAENLLDRFSQQLSPKQIELLLDIEAAATGAQFLWQVVPEIVGAALEDLPRTSVSPEILQTTGNQQAASGVRRMLQSVRSLHDA